MLIAGTLAGSLAAVALLAAGLPTRALGRQPSAQRRRAAAAGVPSIVLLQLALLVHALGPAAGITLAVAAWMCAGWAFTALLDAAPAHRCCRASICVGTVGLAMALLVALYQATSS